MNLRMSLSLKCLLATLAFSLASTPSTFAAALTEEQKIAELEDLMTYLVMARGAATGDQARINNPDIGDKGINADSVIAKSNENYEKKTGRPFLEGNADPFFTDARRALVASIRDVMDDVQPLINEKGKGFKGFIPAVFRSQVSRKFSEKMANKITFQPTAPKSLLRNRKHRPDAWEKDIMTTKFMPANYPKGKPYAASVNHKGKPTFRYMKPMYYKEKCLACHGEPKGERDSSGYRKEGVKKGQFAGAMSFIVWE